MGIRDLLTFLHKRNIPFERHRATYFARSTIAVDGYSLFFRLYYAAKKIGFRTHKETAINLLDTFIRKWPTSTILIFVLDNPIKSDLKRRTIDKRRQDEQALQKEIRELTDTAEGFKNPVLLARRETLRQRSKETFPEVCRNMIDFLRTKGYKILVSEGEAEKTACNMVIAGEAQYVYSNDSDCFALSCPAIIFEDVGGYLHLYRLDSVLGPLHLDPHEFTDFCILLGTDFNDRIQPPEEAFQNITTFRSIEKIPSLSKDQIDNLKKVREQYSEVASSLLFLSAAAADEDACLSSPSPCSKAS